MTTKQSALPYYILHLMYTGLDDRDPGCDVNPTISSEELRDEFIKSDEDNPVYHTHIDGFPAIKVCCEFQEHYFVEMPYDQTFHISSSPGLTPMIMYSDEQILFEGIYDALDNESRHPEYLVMMVK